MTKIWMLIASLFFLIVPSVIAASDDSWMCAGVGFNLKDVEVFEGRTKTVEFEIENIASKDFEIRGIEVTALSAPFLNATITDYDDELDSDDSVVAELEIKAGTVPATMDAPVYLRIKGRFENDVVCDYIDIIDYFTVTVLDTEDDNETCTSCNTKSNCKRYSAYGTCLDYYSASYPYFSTSRNAYNPDYYNSNSYYQNQPYYNTQYGSAYNSVYGPRNKYVEEAYYRRYIEDSYWEYQRAMYQFGNPRNYAGYTNRDYYSQFWG